MGRRKKEALLHASCGGRGVDLKAGARAVPAVCVGRQHTSVARVLAHRLSGPLGLLHLPLLPRPKRGDCRGVSACPSSCRIYA